MRRVCVGGDAAGKKKEKTIGELASRPVVVQPDQKVEASTARAMDNYRRFLELQKTDPQLRAEALRRLGDLNMEAGEGERMAGEASTIDLQGAEAIKLYTSLLKSYPDYPRNDQVLYQLARAYETTGQPEKALTTLDEVLRRYPRSPQMDEVQFRRGELLFSAREYRKAQDAYQYVVTKGDKAAFLSQSLYKHGWSLFKQGLNDESLPSFAGVLDRTMLAKDTHALIPLEKLPRASRELADDTLRVMAVTFSYNDDSVDAIDQFLIAHNNPQYAPVLYSRLGDLYVEKERFQDAAAVYRAFATREPNSEYSPGLSMQAIDAYRKGGFTALVLEGKREYVALYNYGTPFWQGRNKADYPNIAKELKTNLKDVATYFHASAQKSKKVDEYREAARWYRTYLESFPDDPDSFGTQLPAVRDALREPGFPGRRDRIHQDRIRLSAQSAVGRGGLCRARILRQVRSKLAARGEDRGAQARGGCRREIRHQLSRTSRQRGRVDARRRRHLCDAGPAALDRSRKPGARAPAAGRPAEAPHRLHHHRPGEFRSAAVRRSGEGLHRRARSAAA